MDPTVEEYITYLNNEANRLSSLVDTPIGNWIPEPTFNEAMQLVKKFEEYLPTIKDWVKAFESDSANHAEIWLRQGLFLASNRHHWDKLEHHIYAPAKCGSPALGRPAIGFTSLDGTDYKLDYTEPAPPKPEMTPEIEAMHENKPCDFNGWYCWHCDDQEHEVYKLHQQLIKASRNIFINESLKEPFIKAALEANLQPPNSWNLEDYFQIKTRDYDDCNDEPKKGQTYGQQVKYFILKHMKTIRFSASKYSKSPCDYYMQIKIQLKSKDEGLKNLKAAAALIKS
jgi:hypothetical protein